jgi:hypothetical protein
MVRGTHRNGCALKQWCSTWGTRTPGVREDILGVTLN